MNFDLTDEQAMLVGSVRSFVERELFPHEDEVERTGGVEPAVAIRVVERAKVAGIFAANMPKDVGGGGLSHLETALMERELGKASFALHDLVARPSRILLACESDQVERYLKPCIAGDKSECFALTEPSAGSDAYAIATRAVRDGDEWVLNGQKHFISGGEAADFAIVFAVTGIDETERGRRSRISAFLVDSGTPGFEVRPGRKIVSHRGYAHAELFFADCRVSSSQMLGEEGQGFALADRWLADSRVVVAAQCVGRARRVLEMAVEWAAEREQFGKAIGRFQGVGFKLADMLTALEAAELLVLRAAWKMDQGAMTETDASMAKLAASEMLGRVADEAVQIYGGLGLVEELPIERFWRDARIERIWDGTSEIQRHIISRALLRPHEGRS